MTLALHRDYDIVIGQIMGNGVQVIYGHEQRCLQPSVPRMHSYCKFCMM